MQVEISCICAHWIMNQNKGGLVSLWHRYCSMFLNSKRHLWKKCATLWWLCTLIISALEYDTGFWPMAVNLTRRGVLASRPVRPDGQTLMGFCGVLPHVQLSIRLQLSAPEYHYHGLRSYSTLEICPHVGTRSLFRLESPTSEVKRGYVTAGWWWHNRVMA